MDCVQLPTPPCKSGVQGRGQGLEGKRLASQPSTTPSVFSLPSVGEWRRGCHVPALSMSLLFRPRPSQASVSGGAILTEPLRSEGHQQLWWGAL